MPRKTIQDFPAEIWPLFNSYVHGRSSRRDFLEKAAKFAAVPFYGAQPIAEDAKRIEAPLSVRASSTASTTIRRPVTTMRRPSWPGSAPSISSKRT